MEDRVVGLYVSAGGKSLAKRGRPSEKAPTEIDKLGGAKFRRLTDTVLRYVPRFKGQCKGIQP